MHCIRPINASQNSAGDLVYNNTKAMPGLVGWQLPCRKCLPCRLNIAREKAIRATHEASLHENNIFLTLTYNDASLTSQELIYEDFQLFMKKLRKTQPQKIPVMVTGEYGEINKRPHWHALLFNYAPTDGKLKYTTKNQEPVYTSEKLEKLWNKGNLEYGSVTMDSANYVARYAAKKLVHGKDQEHQYHPIHKTSSKNAIGKGWIEKNYKHTFENGHIVLPNGQISKIPRYYVDWYKKHHGEKYENYIANVALSIQEKSEKKARKEEIQYISDCINRKGGKGHPEKRNNVKLRILNSKFKQLQENLKL